MAESSSGATKPKQAEYLTVPMPAPNGAAGPPAAAPLTIRSIDPVPAKDPSDAIVEAAETLLRAATARIAYHENHAERLRKALAALGAVGLHRQDTAHPPVAGDTLEKLLRIAENMEGQT